MSPLVRGLVHGVLLGGERLRRRGVFVAGATVVVAAMTALVERRLGPIGALDRSLGITAAWILPLAIAALVTAVFGLRRPRDLAWSVARWGAPRAAVTAGVIAVLSLASAALAAVSGALVVLVAHSTESADAPLGADVVVTAGVSALVGWAYAAALSFGATFGRRGGGRAIALALDFVLGGMGVVGYLLPRLHGLRLLGLDAASGSQRASSVALVAIAVGWTALATIRSRD